MPPYRVANTTVADYPTVTLISPNREMEATYAPGIGMVGCSLKHRGEELLHPRGGLSHYATIYKFLSCCKISEYR